MRSVGMATGEPGVVGLLSAPLGSMRLVLILLMPKLLTAWLLIGDSDEKRLYTPVSAAKNIALLLTEFITLSLLHLLYNRMLIMETGMSAKQILSPRNQSWLTISELESSLSINSGGLGGGGDGG